MQKKRNISIFVLIDALGWEYIRDRGFLNDVLTFRRPLTTVLGFSSGAIPTILTGFPPQDHGHWNLFYFDPDGSPFRFSRPLAYCPERVVNRRVVRKVFKEIGRRALGLGRGFECIVSPRVLSYFNFVETKNIYEPGGIPGVASIFDYLVAHNIEYRAYSYHRHSDAEILRRAADDIQNSTVGFFFLYLSELDAFLHYHCSDTTRLEERLEWYERGVRELYAGARRLGEDVTLAVFSDHGMTPVLNHVDLVAQIEALPLRTPSDYLAVYDSTMARFWYFNERAREEIISCLKGCDCGRILPHDVLNEYGLGFGTKKFGETIFLLHPGWLLAKSDFHGRQSGLAGMHGYDPDDRFSHAVYLSNRTPAAYMSNIRDIYPRMIEAAAPGGEVGVSSAAKSIGMRV